MGRIKDMNMKQLKDAFEFECSYQEWLRDNLSEPSKSEIEGMEQDYKKQSCFQSKLIPSDKALNNTNYNPIIEA